ncbi:MAG: sugar ABC transporter permease [Oscillospiraceae bacterium]|jgi:putative aldouronate transport system permease protein|nr:sugar ABC transporter permease [Oscillospiraceae bacterium]
MNKKDGFLTCLCRYYDLYLMLVPALIYVVVFHLLPMIGILIAFKDYNMFAVPGSPFRSILESPWAGFKYFQQVFSRKEFLNAFANTLIISVYKIIFIFPLPIIFAIFLNEVRSNRFQKGLQLIVYLPHFLSWVVIYGIFVSFLSSTGIINTILGALGMNQVSFLMDSSKFRGILVISDAWKEIGWSSIIYFSAIAGMDQECFDAADVDGATRLQKIWYITVPSLLPTIVLMLIIRIGNIMNAGFDQIFVFYNPTVYDVADIIGTYVYRMGLGKLEFSTGTAVGLFNSVISMTLVLTSNFVARRLTGKGIW